MRGDVVTVASGKGGVGKTTTAVNLAVALRQRGHPVVVLDADLGMPNVERFFDLDVERSVHDVLAGEADVAERPGEDDDAVVELAEGLAVLAGDRSLDGFAEADPGELESVIDTLARRYRYVIVDTGSSLTYESLLPIELGDGTILVTTPDPASIDDTTKTRQLAQRLDVPVLGVVVTHATDEADATDVASELDVDLFGTVPLETAVSESTADGTPVAAYAPESRSAAVYDRIAAALADDEEPNLEPLDSRARKPGDPASDDADPESPDGRSRAGDDGQEVPGAGSDGGPNGAAETPDGGPGPVADENSDGIIARLSGMFE